LTLGLLFCIQASLRKCARHVALPCVQEVATGCGHGRQRALAPLGALGKGLSPKEWRGPGSFATGTPNYEFKYTLICAISWTLAISVASSSLRFSPLTQASIRNCTTKCIPRKPRQAEFLLRGAHRPVASAVAATMRLPPLAWNLLWPPLLAPSAQ